MNTPKKRFDAAHMLTRSKAEALAERIRRYWAERGVRVRVWLEPLNSNDNEWTVRSTVDLQTFGVAVRETKT